MLIFNFMRKLCFGRGRNLRGEKWFIPAADFVRSQTSLKPVALTPEIVIQQATNEFAERWLDRSDVNPPFWSIAWPGGQALARYVLDNPEIVRGKRVMDFATGSGLVAIGPPQACCGCYSRPRSFT